MNFEGKNNQQSISCLENSVDRMIQSLEVPHLVDEKPGSQILKERPTDKRGSQGTNQSSDRLG